MTKGYIDEDGIVLTEEAKDKHRAKCPSGKHSTPDGFCQGEECEYWDVAEPAVQIRGKVAGVCMKVVE